MSVWKNFIKGIIKENPVLVLLLGTCPTGARGGAPYAVGVRGGAPYSFPNHSK